MNKFREGLWWRTAGGASMFVSVVARETVSISFVDVRISGIVIAVVVVVVRPGRVAPTIRRRRGPGRTGGGGGGGRIDDGGTRSNMVTTNR